MGGRHTSLTNDLLDYEKQNPGRNKTVKVRKGNCDTCGRKKSQIFTEKKTRGEDSEKKGNFTEKLCLPMSNSACCDLNSKGKC